MASAPAGPGYDADAGTVLDFVADASPTGSAGLVAVAVTAETPVPPLCAWVEVSRCPEPLTTPDGRIEPSVVAALAMRRLD